MLWWCGVVVLSVVCCLFFWMILRLKAAERYKIHPVTGHEGPESEQRQVKLYSFINLVLDGGGWSSSRPCRFTPGKGTLYPLYRRLGGPQGQSGWVQKISPPPGFVTNYIVQYCGCHARNNQHFEDHNKSTK
jgi:hypothetical protein